MKEIEVEVVSFDPSEPFRTCSICYDDVNDVNIFKIGAEYHDICMKCMKDNMKELISNGKVNKIQCPHC